MNALKDSLWPEFLAKLGSWNRGEVCFQTLLSKLNFLLMVKKRKEIKLVLEVNFELYHSFIFSAVLLWLRIQRLTVNCLIPPPYCLGVVLQAQINFKSCPNFRLTTNLVTFRIFIDKLCNLNNRRQMCHIICSFYCMDNMTQQLRHPSLAEQQASDSDRGWKHHS